MRFGRVQGYLVSRLFQACFVGNCIDEIFNLCAEFERAFAYVMNDFRFHMTLTGRLGSERREGVLVLLKERFSALDLATLAIDRIAVFRQESAGSRFRIVSQWELRAAGAGGVITDTASMA